MNDNKWALVGNWSFIRGKPKGLSVYRYDEHLGKLEFKETLFGDLYIGQQNYDPDKNIDYFTDEIGHRPGELGGGGHVGALKTDKSSGKVNILNIRDSLSPEPSYLCRSRSGRFLIAVHHADDGHVTKISFENGKYRSRTLVDDAAVVLFRINEDGSIGEPCDVYIVEGSGDDGIHAIPHLHCVVPDPTGEIYCVCDKGTDSIFMFRICEEEGRLELVSTLHTPDGTSPRYMAFHPTLPIVYINFERIHQVHAYSYSVENGFGGCIGVTELLQDVEKAENTDRVEASDILFDKKRNMLYVCVRGVDLISVMRVNDCGQIEVIQNEECHGDPRGITMSPDGRFMFACNMMAGTISVFTVNEDGTIVFRDNDTRGVSPANMIII